ncbi:MAG: phosphoribosylamine--glycine ligase [Proteobacteria bacterium]|nr:phosphoribosylamine--glycine ligase [Pseudomonadota bacterium]
MNVLIIGSGGREHALAWAIKKSHALEKLYCAPGNAGIENLATCLPVAVDDIPGIVDAAKKHQIGLVVIGPEGPLVAGLADALRDEDIPVFGPNKNAAQIEGSKGFMKDLCASAGVPTAKYKRFTSAEEARAYVKQKGAPIVVKADGLAAGKGVTVAMTLDEAMKAIDQAMVEDVFGEAGKSVVIEEYMEGEEASFFALVDGDGAMAFAHAQDHKRAFDGDQGPNTGGMGAYSPAPIISRDMQERVMRDIIFPTARALAAAEMPFNGVLFAGLMITKTGPRLIEFNARFGDPETQAILPRLQSDLLDALYKTATGELRRVKLEWKNEAALCVVMAAKGYPGAYEKGSVIKGLQDAAAVPNAVVFHAGTRGGGPGEEIQAWGGRVLGVTGWGKTVKEAQHHAYWAVDQIEWEQGFCRRDIGWRALA